MALLIQDSSPNIDIVSVHIPKTAGSTFGHVFLYNLYTREQISYDYEWLPVEDILPKLPAETRVIHGHFQATKYRTALPNAKIITWIRHPFSQLISWYFFWLAPPKGVIYNEDHRYFLESKMSFATFLTMPYVDNSFSNFYLQGVDLDDFYFIGLQEFFAEDVQDLSRMMKRPDIVFPEYTINENTYPDYRVRKQEILADPKIVDLLRQRNQKDLILYQNVLKLRAKRKLCLV
jgi:Sulfotransferase family